MLLIILVLSHRRAHLNCLFGEKINRSSRKINSYWGCRRHISLPGPVGVKQDAYSTPASKEREL